MIIEIKDKLVSTELFSKEFVCNLTACKGACCVEGDTGAPLTVEEVGLLEDHLEEIKPLMTKAGIAEVKRTGVSYLDSHGEPVTSIVKGKDCVFVYRDENKITKCAIQQSYVAGKIPFNKPISCHLYPIRVKKMEKFEALNYDRWSICSDACKLGKELKVPVYKFLKEPLIRAYGPKFYSELEKADRDLAKEKLI